MMAVSFMNPAQNLELKNESTKLNLIELKKQKQKYKECLQSASSWYKIPPEV